jgi:hypothetical protein
MSKVVFTGCSFTNGNGWITDAEKSKRFNLCKFHPDLWVNLCHTQIDQLKNLELVNRGQGGATNTEIFKNSVRAIAEHNTSISVMFCQWTSMPRYTFRSGFELWNTTQSLSRRARGKVPEQAYIDNILDRFLALHHVQDEIAKFLDYVNTLQKLADQMGITMYHINGLCPWDNNFFVRLNHAMPADYTPFTKKEILDIDNRDDTDIFKLYQIMHDEYDRAGGINPARWINLYNSFKNNIIDVNYDRHHPGTQSNQLYFQQVKQFLESQ